MKRSAPRVTSREYKMVLDSTRFTGNENELINKSREFWKETTNAIHPSLAGVEGDLDTVKNRRAINFYDTLHHTLYKRHYILRERKAETNGKRELTLKCRHPDRYIVQSRNMRSQGLRNNEMKFEEDIKVPFIQLYSFSSGGWMSKKDKLSKLNHAIGYFPGLSEELGDREQDEVIEQVHDETIQELVITGGSLTLGADQKAAECALITWYGSTHPSDEPIIVEFSFRYGDKRGRYDRQSARMAFDIFELIQEKMTAWLGKGNATKTGLIFANH